MRGGKKFLRGKINETIHPFIRLLAAQRGVRGGGDVITKGLPPPPHPVKPLVLGIEQPKLFASSLSWYSGNYTVSSNLCRRKNEKTT
jgi:hypothetical protein